jgi:hypothetical protein
MNDEDFFTGSTRPPNIPQDWQGRPLKANKGWLWYDPVNEGNQVFLYRSDPDSPDLSTRTPYVIVIKDGLRIDRNGNTIPNSSIPDD